MVLGVDRRATCSTLNSGSLAPSGSKSEPASLSTTLFLGSLLILEDLRDIFEENRDYDGSSGQDESREGASLNEVT